MNLLLDTHILLWAGNSSDKLPILGRELIADINNELFFSPASLWEIVIKNSLGRSDFKIDVHVFRRNLLDNGYVELSILSEHVVAIDGLPPIHRDPFDRILVAQSIVEGITLLTADDVLAQYPGPIKKI